MLYKLKAGSCRRTQFVEEAQTTLVVLEYIWMCLRDELIVSSGARQLLDKFVAQYAYFIVAYYPAAAPSDSVFRALRTNLLTYLFWIYLRPQKFNFNTFFRGGGQ